MAEIEALKGNQNINNLGGGGTRGATPLDRPGTASAELAKVRSERDSLLVERNNL